MRRFSVRLTSQAPVVPWRPFIWAAWLFALSVGALSGAVDLWVLRARLTPVPLEHARAHGLAQLFGFLGLFVMGVSLQMAPSFFRGAPPPGRLARGLGWLAIGGVTGVVAARLGRLVPGTAVVGVLGGAALVAAYVLWGAWVVRLWRKLTVSLEPLHHFVLAGTAWWVLAAVLVALGELLPVPQEATWAAALLGGASGWTWGIFQRAGICQLQLQGPSRPQAMRLFYAWQGMTALQVLAAWHPGTAWQPVASAAHAVTVGLLTWTLRPYAAPGGLAPQPRAMQAGLAFVGISGALSAWAALRWLGLPAPALLTDAARHAYTLGGMVLLVSGFGGRMLPSFASASLRWPRLYVAGLLGVGVGAALRLVELVAAPWALTLAGASGGVSWLGMALLAAVLWPARAVTRPSAPQAA